MTVSKVYFKIIKSNIAGIGMYIVVFLIIAIMMTKMESQDVQDTYKDEKIKISIINNDEDSKVVEGLKEYLGDKADIKNISTDEESIKDALFVRQIEYVVKIPKNFTADLNKGSDVNIEKVEVEKSFSSVYMDSIINKYINTWKDYKDNTKNLSDKEIISHIKEDLSKETKVTLIDEAKNKDVISSMNYYYNYAAYATIGALIIGICYSMYVFDRIEIKRRNLCSPIKQKRINYEIIFSNFVFSSLVFIINVTAGIFIYGNSVFSEKGLTMTLNLFVFTIVSMAISLLISSVVKTKSAAMSAATTISIALSFISGIFIPQSLIGDNVKLFVSFTPTFWYVKANNEIATLSDFNWVNSKSIVYSIAIEIGFAIALISITLLIRKFKSQSEN